MMRQIGEKLNDLMVESFNLIKKVEGTSLRAAHGNDLTICEYHLMESVGKGGATGKTISEIASDLSVTLASVTVGINKLVKKKYAEKIKRQEDGRMVFVCLTREGRRMNAGHRLFHEGMVREVCGGFDDSELELLIGCFEKLNSYFRKKTEREL